MKYVCQICGFVYDEAEGLPSAGIAPGTSWNDLPADWKCPICGADKSAFIPEGSENSAPIKEESLEDLRPLNAMETSALCSNLARGCEKQALAEQAEAFLKLAEYFAKKAEPVTDASFDSLMALIEQDLSAFPLAKATGERKHDRGALRSLVWSEKVTRMLSSILSRVATEGEKVINAPVVYVCTICGFVYIGDNPPERCPVCKVPNFKFERIGG